MPSSLLDELWARMAASYGHTWTSQYDADDSEIGVAARELAYAHWSEALAGVSSTQMLAGLRADLNRGSEWPPSAALFRALCLGIPSYAAIRHEMTHPELSRTPFGLLCWRYVDMFRLRTANQQEADRLVHDAYELAREHVMTGGELPEVPEALAKPEPPPKRYASEDEVREHLRAIHAVIDRQELANAATSTEHTNNDDGMAT